MPTATAASARYDKRTMHYEATVHVAVIDEWLSPTSTQAPA
jgi:hypothetical protein